MTGWRLRVQGRSLVHNRCCNRAVEILAWANEHDFVLISNDLDFSAILAAGAVSGPSVIQLRTQDLLSDAPVSIVATALEAHRENIERSALLSIDEGGTRVRMLPLRHSRKAHDGNERGARFRPLISPIHQLSIASKAELQSRLNAPEMPELLHPCMAGVYREKVGSLCSALESEENRTAAAEAIRALIETILLEPGGDDLKITLKGNLAGMLRVARDSKRSPDTGDLLVQIKLVAGAGFEPDLMRFSNLLMAREFWSKTLLDGSCGRKGLPLVFRGIF